MESNQNPNNQELIQEYNIRAAREHLTIFAKATMPTFDPTWFHVKYYQALNDFAEGKIKKLMIFIAPQHGKSLGSTQMLPAYLLGKNPDLKIAIVCYNAGMAEKFNRGIQRKIDDPAYRVIFPNTALSNGTDGYVKNNTEIEVVNHQGGVRSVGIGGGLTGQTVDCLIMDDLYKDAADAWSPVVRENVESWYSTVAETRLHNNSQQLIVFTRWHHEDLAGKLLADPEHDWTVISYPAIKEGEPTEEDPRQEGEALYPERHDIDRLIGIRNRDAFTFESLYQQNPQPKEGLLYQPFKTYSEIPVYAKLRKAYVDTADLGKDYLCSIAYAEDKDGMYVLDVIYTQVGMEVTEPLTAKQFHDHSVRHANIESNNGGRGFCRSVQKLSKDRGNYAIRIEWFSQNLNKNARINTNSTSVNNLIHMPEGWQMKWPIFNNHVSNYSAIGKNKHDDAPDTLTGMVEKFIGTRRQSNTALLSVFR